MENNIKVYLAGPDVFLPNVIEIGEMKKELCKKYGFEGLFPMDTELNLEGLEPYSAGLIISEANEELIRKSDFVIANITPFRGPSADVGTIYEIGFAKALGKLVYAYTNTKKLFTERTKIFLGLEENVNCDNNKMIIEKWGMVDNLMIDGGIKSSNGSIVANDLPENEMYTGLVGFEKCLKLAQGFFLNKSNDITSKVIEIELVHYD